MILIVPQDFVWILIALAAFMLFVFIPVVLFYFPYVVHLHMSEDNEYYVYADKVYSFKEFKKEFDEIDWEEDPIFKGSLFADRDLSVYHAEIIKLNGEGILIKNFIHYNLAKLYVKKHLKKENQQF